MKKFTLLLCIIAIAGAQLRGMHKELAKSHEKTCNKALKALNAGNIEKMLEYAAQKKFDCNYQYPQEENRTLLSCLCKKRPQDFDAQSWTNQLPQEVHTALEILIEKPGLSLSIPDKNGWMTLHYAASNPDSRLLARLLSLKDRLHLDVQRRNPHNGWTPLHMAVERGLVANVKLLLSDAQVNPNLPTSDELYPICQIGTYPGIITISKDLVEAGAYIDTLSRGKSAFGHACKTFQGRMIPLLALGAAFKPYQDEFHVIMPKLIAKSFRGEGLLNDSFRAALLGTRLNPFHILTGPEINAQDVTYDMTPLMWAAARGNLALAQQLARADHLLTDKYGNTALHIAVRNGHVQLAEYLSQQAPLALLVKNENGKTPVDLAIAAKKSREMLLALAK